MFEELDLLRVKLANRIKCVKYILKVKLVPLFLCLEYDIDLNYIDSVYEMKLYICYLKSYHSFYEQFIT